MDRIVIVTEQPEGRYNLALFLRSLFPDCDIEIVPAGVDSNEENATSSYSSLLKPQKMGRA
jgi:hypothetical protein